MINRELPRYVCHKQVWALRIGEMKINEDGSAILVPREEGYAPVPVTKEWVERHKPEAGGYYVVYKDGYTSYSPKRAFQEGYSKE